MKNVIDYFIITATMTNGEKWETIRHTRDGLLAVMNDIWEDEDNYVSFSVKEKYYKVSA